jgi:hypothetical protein
MAGLFYAVRDPSTFPSREEVEKELAMIRSEPVVVAAHGGQSQRIPQPRPMPEPEKRLSSQEVEDEAIAIELAGLAKRPGPNMPGKDAGQVSAPVFVRVIGKTTKGDDAIVDEMFTMAESRKFKKLASAGPGPGPAMVDEGQGQTGDAPQPQGGGSEGKSDDDLADELFQAAGGR